MGLEKERSDTSIIMDQDEFNRSIEPILSHKEKAFTATAAETQDRDPNDINAHLKVKRNCCGESEIEGNQTSRTLICSVAL